jgi:hypothetical protein
MRISHSKARVSTTNQLALGHTKLRGKQLPYSRFPRRALVVDFFYNRKGVLATNDTVL